ncbi:hypothetical protein GGI35DRAFT_256426 [Trichoderma velutinum]
MNSKSLYPRSPKTTPGRALLIGLGAGALGAAVMVATEKVEQFFTHRPNSYVPADTISTHLGLFGLRRDHPDLANSLHHFGMGILTAPIRAAMSYCGVIGPIASYIFLGFRIYADQVVEISADASTVPWRWPITEQVVDLVHKGFYSIVVGYLCDKYVRGVDWFN